MGREVEWFPRKAQGWFIQGYAERKGCCYEMSFSVVFYGAGENDELSCFPLLCDAVDSNDVGEAACKSSKDRMLATWQPRTAERWPLVQHVHVFRACTCA